MATRNNGVDTRKIRTKISNVVSMFTPIVVLIVVIVTSYLDDIKIAAPIVLIALVVMILVYIIIYKAVDIFHNSVIGNYISYCKSSIAYNADISVSTEDNKIPQDICREHGFICCAQRIQNSPLYGKISEQVNLTQNECDKYNLITDTSFDEIESHYFDDHPNGEIWVISYSLETEIKTEEELRDTPDDSLVKSMEVVRENLKKGGRYTQFVALGPNGDKDIVFENRCREYRSAMPEITEESAQKRAMPIIRIDDDFDMVRNRIDDPDWEYMVKLTSTVLFVDDSPHKKKVDGYFCFRPDDADDAAPYARRTIFLKMPRCMRDDYYYFLKQKKEEYLRGIE